MFAITKWKEEWEIQNQRRWEEVFRRLKLAGINFLSIFIWILEVLSYGLYIFGRLLLVVVRGLLIGPQLVRRHSPEQVPVVFDPRELSYEHLPKRF